jgi:hypothetical protein
MWNLSGLRRGRGRRARIAFEKLGGGAYVGTEEIFGNVFMTTANTTKKEGCDVD